MVSADLISAHPFGEMPRHAFGEARRVYENKGCPMRVDEFRQPVVKLLPDLNRHDGLERGRRHFERQIPRSAVAGVYDHARRRWGFATCSGQEMRNRFDRLLRCGQADPQKRFPGEGL